MGIKNIFLQVKNLFKFKTFILPRIARSRVQSTKTRKRSLIAMRGRA